MERLQEVDQVKDTFVSSVSHELRTPITSILGYLEMLIEGEFGELASQQELAVRRIDTNSKRLLSLIDELLTLARVHERQAGDDRRRSTCATSPARRTTWWRRRGRSATWTPELRLPDEEVPSTATASCSSGCWSTCSATRRSSRPTAAR